MPSPYLNLPPERFWRSGVAGAAANDFPNIFTPRFEITPGTRIATAGSCFAQHVGRHLRSLGFQVIDAEPAPPGLTDEEARRFGFRLYSARHGNIYTTRQLLLLIREALGQFTPGAAIWTRDGRYYDALRPTVEPEGLGSEEAVRRHRAAHLARFLKALQGAELLVFTMGLVETWMHLPTGTVYPTAPGVVAESEAASDIVLHSFDMVEVLEDLRAIHALLAGINPDYRILLTVSPVPLTATATEDHVLVATTYAKATLRAAAGRIRQENPGFDYFPSYEIVAGHPSRGRFYAPNLREVTAEGVSCVMRHFVGAYDSAVAPPPPLPAETETDAMDAAEELICDEMLLDAFQPQPIGGA